MAESIHINAVAYQAGGAWIAQGIEYDIVAYADDPFRLADAFSRAVIENICITKHLGRKPLQGLKPAPMRFREMYNEAGYELRPTKQGSDAEVAVRVAA